MREMIFKNISSAESRKKEILLKEVFEKDGVIAKTERRSFYFVKDVIHMDEDEDPEKWLVKKESSDQKTHDTKRHFHILKEHNEEHGEDKLICKIIGTFYAVVGKTVYTITFLHSFKVSFIKVFLTK